jgi:hypothetical protein
MDESTRNLIRNKLFDLRENMDATNELLGELLDAVNSRAITELTPSSHLLGAIQHTAAQLTDLVIDLDQSSNE